MATSVTQMFMLVAYVFLLLTQIVPAVVRSLRRTPEVAVTALSALLAHAPQLDVSSHTAELGSILVQQVGTDKG